MKNKINIAMIGGRGFVGQEIISILNDHPIFMLSKVFSKTAGGEVVEGYKKTSNLKYCLLDKSNLQLENVDIAIMALANDESESFISIIKNQSSSLPRFVVHCFTGTQKQLDDYLDLGAFIGLTGWICDEKRNQDLRASVKNIPLDRLMLETDCPYLVPKNLPVKAKKNINEPKYLPHIAKEVSELMGISIESLRDATSQNAENFFT